MHLLNTRIYVPRLRLRLKIERFQSEKFSASDVRMHIDLLKKIAGKRENVEAGAPMYTPTPEKKEETPESFQNESGWTVGYYRGWSVVHGVK